MAISDILASIDHEIAQLQQARALLGGGAKPAAKKAARQTQEGGRCTQEGRGSCTGRREASEKEEETPLSRGAEADRRGCQKALGGKKAAEAK